MSCGCPKIERTGLWTPVPRFNRPATDIQFGENIDCYMRRAGDGIYEEANVLGPKPVNRIDNTSLTSDTQGNVQETFKLTPESDKVPTRWSATVNGQDIQTQIPNLTFDESTGVLSGQVQEAYLGKNYAVMITAYEGNDPIDAREFNFYPKDASKEDTIRFVLPLVGPGARITSSFGPRRPPASGASKVHKGIDLSCTEGLGDIVAAADGIVTKVGPANGFGNWIHIDHYDASNRKVATTLYAHMHLNTVTVRVGQRVSAGQKIAVEGNAGIGSGAHLHFELHKGGYKNPVDPVPYFSGEPIPVPTNSGNTMGPDGAAVPIGTETRPMRPAPPGMTAGESNTAPCPTNPNRIDTSIPSGIDEGAAANNPNVQQASGNNVEPSPADNVASLPQSEVKNPCMGVKGVSYTPDQIRNIIREECLAEGLAPDDADFLINVARIESSFNPYATNPKSSATGLFQMLNKTAASFYAAIGIPNPTCEQRADPRLATRAQIAWYKKEMLPIWNRFVASGKTRIAGQIKPTAHSGMSPPHYAGLSKSEFLYGLIHHDGMGNATNGIDLGGVKYWRSRMS